MLSANVSSGTVQRASLLTHVAWSPDDKLIVACFGNRPPAIIDAATRKVICELAFQVKDKLPSNQLAHYAHSIGYLASWSPAGDQVAVGKDRMIHIMDVHSGRTRSTHTVRLNPASADESLAALAQDPVLSRLPPMGSREEQVRRLDKYLESVPLGLTTLRWDDRGISIGTPIGAYRLDMERKTKKMALRPYPCPGIVRSPVASPDGKFLAGLFVPDADVLGDLFWNFNRALNVARRVLRIWNLETGECEVEYLGDDLPDWQQCRLYWSADSQKLAWGYDNKVILFELERQSARVLVRSQDDHIDVLAWHPTKNHLAVEDRKEGIIVYDTASSVKRASYKEALWGRYKDIGERVFAWSNAGESIAVGGHRDNVDVWKVYAAPRN